MKKSIRQHERHRMRESRNRGPPGRLDMESYKNALNIPGGDGAHLPLGEGMLVHQDYYKGKTKGK